MKLIKKILAILAVAIQVILLGNSVNAASIGETKSLERGPLGYYCVQKWDGSKWIYLTYNTTYYTDANGKKYVAYCLSPGAPGVGYVSGEKETYNVKIKELLNDDRIWRIIKNGYPYKTLQELGVETVDDAYFATMQAVNSVLRGYTLEQAKELYVPGKFAINGENYDEVKRRGEKTLNAMFSLINIGLNGKESRKDLLGISVTSTTNFIKENDNYYSQMYKVTSRSAINEYNIDTEEGLPNGAYIADIQGNKKKSFSSGESFKVMIPKKEINRDINVKITIKASQKNYPIYYGESQIAGHQDYALCSEETTNVFTTVDMKVTTNKSKLSIVKVDTETNKPLKGVKFQITNSNNITNTYTTDENGKIELSNLYAGTVKIKEIESLENYKPLKDEIVVNLEYGETREIKIKNEIQKGNIIVKKVDKDNEKIKLENVKIRLIDKNGKIISEGKTNCNGILEFNNLAIGTYTIQEIETLDNYILSNEDIKVEVLANKTSEICLKNERKKGNIKVIKVDYDNNDIRLENVKFQLKDKNGKVIQEKITNKEGEIYFEGLSEGKYTLTEIETQKEYMLQENSVDVEIKYGETSEVVVKNKKIQVIEIPVVIEKIVEIEKEVEKIVEVEKPVEIERVVEKPIEVEKIIEKPVEVEKIVEKTIEVEKIVEKPIEVEKIVEKPVELEKIVEKPIEVEKIVEKPVEIERIVEKPVEKIIYKELPKTGGNTNRIFFVVSIISFVLYCLALIVRSKKNKKNSNNSNV